MLILIIVIAIMCVCVVVGANKNKDGIDFPSLSDIVITDKFKEHPPRAEKMNAKIRYLFANSDYEQPIVVNSKNELIDGYTTYLIALGTNIPATIIKIEN